ELFDARFEDVRVTLVELSRDGSRARIWYCMTSDFDAVRVAATQAAFSRASAYFRTRLCDALPLKRTPELSFRHDPVAVGEALEQD
ncbi:MAG TPA: ribosome-binding factor A, partial [Polyangiaceae bacterium]|nr:ribosome-binding factor A [Polyangiaceae bacterium]